MIGRLVPLAIGTALSMTSAARAQIVTYDFAGNNGTADPVNSTSHATNISTTPNPPQISRKDGTGTGAANLQPVAHNNTFSTKGFSSRTTLNTTADGYFEFTITPTS